MSDMNFPSSPSDGDEYRKWAYDASTGSWVIIGGGSGGSGSAPLDVTYSSNPPVSVGTEIGDEHFVTSDGTSSGVVSAGYIWNGSAWTNQLSIIDGSGSTNDF
jgi:hypothetical protein